MRKREREREREEREEERILDYSVIYNIFVLILYMYCDIVCMQVHACVYLYIHDCTHVTHVLAPDLEVSCRL